MRYYLMQTARDILNGFLAIITLILLLIVGSFMLLYYIFDYIVRKLNKFRRWF